jgi:hypothetical protein
VDSFSPFSSLGFNEAMKTSTQYKECLVVWQITNIIYTRGIAFGVSVFVVKRENRNFDSDFRRLLCSLLRVVVIEMRV